MRLAEREPLLRRHAMLLLALVLVTANSASAGSAGASPSHNRTHRPNVLFLFTDDQREDTIHALGNPHIKTPNLDRLAQTGLVFRNAYCMGGYSGAVCLPSREMLMTGRAWFSVRGLPKDAPNLPRSMNEAGYVTYHHGKRGNTPVAIQALFVHNRYLKDDEDRTCGYPGRMIADAAIAFLKDHQKAKTGSAAVKPFFMYLAFANPHDPRVAAREYLDEYDAATLPLPRNFKPFHPFNNGELLVRDERLAPWPRPEANIRGQIRDYYAVITAMDAQIGRILRCLEQVGEYQSTIIIFSSDQGIALGSHGLMGKQNLYEHSMGVPLVLSGPGIPRGKSSEAFAYLFDVFPTICELTGARIPDSLDGKSLAPVIRGETTQVRDTIVLAYRDVQRAVRHGRWKLIRYPQINRTQLFDLQEDPFELKDLSGDLAQAGRVQELMTRLEKEQRLFGDKQSLSVEKPRPAEVSLRWFEGQTPQKPQKVRRKKAV
jgi:arylsulfatase A-like enzyme